MSLRTGVAALAVLVSLAVLTLLVWKTQQRPVDASATTQQLIEIAHAARLREALEVELTRVRVEQKTEFAALDALHGAWQTANDTLSGPQLAPAWPATAKPTLRGYTAAATQASELLRQFQEQQLVFVGAFRTFRQLAERNLSQLIARGAPESEPAIITTLVDELARYSLQSQPDNGALIDTLLGQLPASTANLATAARLLRASKDTQQSILNSWAALPLAVNLDALRLGLTERLATQEKNADTYTVALAAYAGALLLVFGLIALRLQSSFSELDAINTDLEKVVQQRTRDLHQALDELRMQQAHLIQSEKMASLGQMVAGVAHEINTPLGYAFSNVETVKESLEHISKAGGLSADADERLEEADVLLEDAAHGLDQIDELVKSLKNFSRMDRSQTELFDLNEGLDTALKICQNTLKDRIRIDKDYQADLPPVHCAPSQLNQVFLNLINNGAQAIEAQGTISLSTRRVEDQIEIRIRDTGCGMDEETRAHIFEPFFTTKPVGEGTGLGLSIVFRIVEDHGGRISVESTPGKGSEFCLRIPLEAPRATAESGQRAVLDDAEPVAAHA